VVIGDCFFGVIGKNQGGRAAPDIFLVSHNLTLSSLVFAGRFAHVYHNHFSFVDSSFSTMTRIQLVSIAALAVVGGADAFHTPSRLRPISIHKGCLIAPSTSAYTNNNYRRDVSVGLFRDLLRKVKDRGDSNNNSGDEENNDEGDEKSTVSTTSAAEQEQQEEEKLPTPFFASRFLDTRAREITTASTSAGAVSDEPEKQPPPPPPNRNHPSWKSNHQHRQQNNYVRRRHVFV